MAYSSDEEDLSVIVVDNGTHHIRAGFAGDDAPRSVFPNLVGQSRARGRTRTLAAATKITYFGYEAVSKQSVLDIVRPMSDGRFNDLDAMTEVWNHMFYNELRVAPEEHPVLMGLRPGTHDHTKEDITEVS